MKRALRTPTGLPDSEPQLAAQERELLLPRLLYGTAAVVTWLFPR